MFITGVVMVPLGTQRKITLFRQGLSVENFLEEVNHAEISIMGMGVI